MHVVILLALATLVSLIIIFNEKKKNIVIATVLHAEAAAGGSLMLDSFLFLINYFFGFIAKTHITSERNKYVTAEEAGADLGFEASDFCTISAQLTCSRAGYMGDDRPKS